MADTPKPTPPPAKPAPPAVYPPVPVVAPKEGLPDLAAGATVKAIVSFPDSTNPPVEVEYPASAPDPRQAAIEAAQLALKWWAMPGRVEVATVAGETVVSPPPPVKKRGSGP